MNFQMLLFPSPVPPMAASLGLLALRIFVGLAFLQHGYGKWMDIPGMMQEFGIPEVLARASALSQMGAALLLIPGLLTPLASLAIAGNMVVAVAKLLERGESFVNPHGHSWESAGIYALLGIGPVPSPETRV